MSVKERIEKIERYLRSQDTSPLSFGRGFTEDLSYLNLDDLVLEIFNLVGIYSSYDEYGCIETSSGKRRSATDIWRHVKLYKPDTKITEVMTVMYNLIKNNTQDVIYTFYCNDINKRVFRLQKYSKWREHNDSFRKLDEFRLYFDDWDFGVNNE